MAKARFGVVGIGSPIVDVVSRCEESFLLREALLKGSMALVDAERAVQLYSVMGAGVEVSGGSAANTIAGVASFGGDAAFIGKVANDELGDVFEHDLRSTGVVYETSRSVDGPPTARSLILVTPDGEKTMCTNLGAASTLAASDIVDDLIAAAQVLYIEGYIWDEGPMPALRKAIDIAHKSGTKFAFSLSDPYCVDRHAAGFLELVENDVDLLFCNEDEILSLFRKSSIDQVIRQVSQICKVAVITRGSNGSVVVTRDETLAIPAQIMDRVEDTTGAGDLYAAGFLFGITTGRTLEACAHLGALAAAEVISHLGARPQVPLASLI